MVPLQIYNNSKLQIAATFCVSNLIWTRDEGAIGRQNKLKEMGVLKILQQLLSTNDPILFEKYVITGCFWGVVDC